MYFIGLTPYALLLTPLMPYLTQVRRSKNFSGGGSRGGRCHRF